MQIIYQYKNFSPFIYQFFLITWNCFNRKFILNEMDELKMTCDDISRQSFPYSEWIDRVGEMVIKFLVYIRYYNNIYYICSYNL